MATKKQVKPGTWVTCSEGIEKKVLKNRDPLYRVRWREGGGRTGPRDMVFFDGHEEAKRFRGALIANGRRDPRKNGLLVEQVDLAPVITLTGVTTLTDAFEEYLASIKKADARQIAGYRRLFDLHVRMAVVTLLDEEGRPTGRKVGLLGNLPIDEVTTEVIEAWVAWMASRTYVYRKARKDESGKTIPAEIRPYSAKTIHNVHGSTISPALGRAARKGMIEANPCAGVELPRLDLKAVSLDEVPTGDELNDWIEIGYEVSSLVGDIITIAVGTGLRWSEIIALRPCDIDLEKRTLRVAQVVKEDANRQLYLAAYGKSDAALRTIRITKALCKVFELYFKARRKREMIFQQPNGGFLRAGNWSKQQWAEVTARAAARGIMTRATIHKFRHAHATELLAQNVSLDTVSKRLGHKSIVVTSLLYSHLVPEADERAAEVIGALMSRKRSRKSKRPAGGLTTAA